MGISIIHREHKVGMSLDAPLHTEDKLVTLIWKAEQIWLLQSGQGLRKVSGSSAGEFSHDRVGLSSDSARDCAGVGDEGCTLLISTGGRATASPHTSPHKHCLHMPPHLFPATQADVLSLALRKLAWQRRLLPWQVLSRGWGTNSSSWLVVS